MAINALIAQGIEPIGKDIPNILMKLQEQKTQEQTNALRQRASDQQQQEFNQGQNDRKLKQALASAQWASQPGVTKDQMLEAMPEIRQGFEQLHGEGSWDIAADADVQQAAKAAVGRLSAQLGVAPPIKAPNTITLKEGESVGTLSPDGKTWTPVASNAKVEKPSWGNPVDEVRGGKPVRVQYDKDGNSRLVEGATPYSKPEKAQSFSQDSVESTAALIANGQIPMLSGPSLRTPWGQSVVARVGQLKPDYNAANFTSASSSLRDFTSGNSAKVVNSLNTGIAHLNTLSNLSEALDNTNSPLFNKVANLWKQQTGQAAPTNFNSAKQIVAAEVVKAISGSGGGVADREEAQRVVDAANSPDQLKQAIGTVRELFAGQLHSRRNMYEQGTGRKDFNRFLLPETIRELSAFDTPTPDAPSAPGAESAAARAKRLGL